MTPQEKDNDRTQVRPPSPTSKNVPERYSASIVIIEGYAEGMEYPIEKAYTVIGRDKNADIAIKDELVSRQHVAIIYAEGRFFLKDLKSTNGVFMRGKRVEQARIQHRDTFRIGDTTIQFVLEDTGAGKVYEIRDEDG